MKAVASPDRRPDPRLKQALANLNEGRAAEALGACQEVLGGDPGQPQALHLLGVALTRLGRSAEAVEALEAAVAALPEAAAIRLALGDAHRACGDLAAAVSAYDIAQGLDPASGAATLRLAAALDACGQGDRAIEALFRRATGFPMDFASSQALVDRVARRIREAPVPAPAPAAHGAVEAGPVPMTFSVGFCSIDPQRAQAAAESLARALAPSPCELHVVTDARSLSEGFNRILDRAQGDVLVLCHDDIEVLSPRLDLVLAEALRETDIVGVAGSRRASGPAVLWSGHPHVHGWVTYPRDSELEAAPLSFRSGLLPGMQALDGVFMAMRREALAGLRFDDATFDGFHFYDLDFTYRAHLAGLRLGVSTDVLLLHASEGQFGHDWKRHAARFLEKHPGLREPQGSPHWYGARFETRDQVRAFYDTIRGLAREGKAT